MVAPVIDNPAAAQRDTAQTFLVDVTFDLSDPEGDDVDVTVEWRRGTTDPWNAAQAQALDRRHNAVNPITSVPTNPANALPITFVWNAFFDMDEGTFSDVFVRITADDGSLQSQETVGPFLVSTAIATQADSLAQAQTRRNILANTPDDFLGCGLLVPFRRGARDFANACGVDLVKACVSIVLGVRASVGEGWDARMGELKWRPDFGNKIWVLKHRNTDDLLKAEAEAYVREAMEWEPRAEVTQVRVEDEPEAAPNELRVRVRNQVIQENVSENRVVLSEFEEIVSL